MSKDLGDGGKGGNRYRCIDLQPFEHFDQIFIPMDGNTVFFGDRDDLGSDCTSPLGQNLGEIIAAPVIAESNSGRWIFAHHPILSDIQALMTPRRSFISW